MKTRDSLAIEETWDVNALFPSIQVWEKQLKKISPKSKAPFWPELAKYRGKLKKGEKVLLQAIESILGLQRALERFYTYAHLKHDEDITRTEFKAAYAKSVSLINQLQQETSWFEPELLALPASILKKYLKSPLLKPYHRLIEKWVRLKPHTLSEAEEKLIALSGNALQTAYKSFSALNDADFKFGEALDSEQKAHPLTHGQYQVILRSKDRVLRENAFKSYMGVYEQYQNTLGELLAGQVQKNLFASKARNYSSSLEAALFPHNIPVKVYRALIKAVNERLPSLHKYMRVRKQHLKLDQLHPYDFATPLVPNRDIKLSYSEAEDLIIESVKPLGDEYQHILQEGLKDKRWVDRYETANKRSGAYSSGCYDSLPYILMNYKGILRDAMTLAHEAGHSMHSYLSRKHQPYQTSDYSIFVAEVASTFNEELLMQTLMNKFSDPEDQLFLINEKIDDIRTTLFRQVLFAEFELAIHELAENHTPLTPQLLADLYKSLIAKYYGKEVVIDPQLTFEWARIPHFYYNFYVYQYATGISAALALSQKVLNGKKKEQEAYLTFLKGGSSRDPIDLLKGAGVDMTKTAPVHAAIDKFDALIKQFETLSKKAKQQSTLLAN